MLAKEVVRGEDNMIRFGRVGNQEDHPDKTSSGACDWQANERLVQRVRGLAEVGILAEEAVERAAAVETVDSVSEAVRRTELVFEALPEDLDLKHGLLAASERAAPADAVIVSNTSWLPMDELAKFVGRPERFLAMHWFNPPSGRRASRSSPPQRTRR